jgi:hypothetical protein
MNAVEIEEAISNLAEDPFDAENFPFQFLEAFGNKPTAIKRLKSGNTNHTDVDGGVLQRNNIHMAVCADGQVSSALETLRASPANTKGKPKFILATDGETLEAEDLITGETVACEYSGFADHFGFFLPLAGITTVKQIRESAFDIKATGRLNRLYVELLKDNPDWSAADRRSDMNHFMARLIFCFFAEDTDIFKGENQFITQVDQMSESDASNTHEVIGEIFRAMNAKPEDRESAGLPRWANVFPYVNGGLFSGSTDAPRFSKIARKYLMHIGSLDWTKINPDIFGSMIQAVADDEERGALGMHYTSVPNILKVLNPLFLDNLRKELEAAGDNGRKLLNLRQRMAKIRVFDPACGSGNFLVIAYKEMRAIEAEINKRRGEADIRSEIPLTNFRGIELRDFPAEIARLALIIAEFQCDVQHRGQKEALAVFLPLDTQNWITCGNALRLDWLSICPSTGTGVKMAAEDLFEAPLDQAEIDFENEGGETYICGNPPYAGHQQRTKEQKKEMADLFNHVDVPPGDLDYVLSWIELWRRYSRHSQCSAAFVMTNSVCQGRQVPRYWPLPINDGCRISFAHTSFYWSNNATKNAAVVCVIVGLDRKIDQIAHLYEGDLIQETKSITPYLTKGNPVFVEARKSEPLTSQFSEMRTGNMPIDGGHFVLSKADVDLILEKHPCASKFIRPFLGSKELNQGLMRYCIWIESEDLDEAIKIPEISKRIDSCRIFREESTRKATNKIAHIPHRFAETQDATNHVIALQNVSSENKPLRTPVILPKPYMISNLCFGLYDGELWQLAVISTKLHHCWIEALCGKLKTDFRYSNTLGWNTFPVPNLTEKNKEDLTCCAEDILLAREAHFPETIADLYDPEKMPDNLRQAHERNDEVLERIYIGRRFKNDTERLEKLFELYTKMTAGDGTSSKKVS